jgi:predicted O-methyltransferase YrrM
MLSSNEIHEESTVSTTAATRDSDLLEVIAGLKSDLHASRAREQAATTVLKNLHQEVERAYLRIAQQQEKLKLLVAQVQTQRASPSAVGAVPSLRESDLRQADHPYRQMTAGISLPHPAPAERLAIANTPGVARIAALWKALPQWASGTISTEDAAFLDAVIEKIRPDQVHEIGVASGTSSALILSTMATYENTLPIKLQSYDLIAKCYFDPSRNVGDATREMVPDLLPYWKLRVGMTALDVHRGKAAGGRPLYFIDANHIHPWPTLDLIALLPGLQPGDCVVLHDINLPAKTGGKFPDYGAQWLFEDWLGPRLEPDVTIPNIGAIFIPDDLRLVLPGIVKSLLRPWTLRQPAEVDHLHRCEQRLAEFVTRRLGW